MTMPLVKKEHELVCGLEVAERIRRHSTEVQRNIEALVEARTRAVEDAQASRDAEEEILYARDHARGRSEPTVIRLRKQLLEMSQELTRFGNRQKNCATRGL